MEPSRCNCAALRRAMRQVTSLYDGVLAPCGMRSSQYTLLANVERREELVMDRSALAHTLATLQRDGLVRVAPDPRDRRVKRVGLTALGSQRLAEARTLWRQGQDRFEAAMGARQADDLRAMMDSLASPDFAERFRASAL